MPQPTSTTKYAFEELSAATDGFSDANFLGRGGFGMVHKGTLQGREVAVKYLLDNQGAAKGMANSKMR